MALTCNGGGRWGFAKAGALDWAMEPGGLEEEIWARTEGFCLSGGWWGFFSSSSNHLRFHLHIRLHLQPILLIPLIRLPIRDRCTAASMPLSEDNDVRQNPRVQDQAITPWSQDFNAWYLDIIANMELANYGPVRGTMIIRPYGYAIWEAIKDYLNVKIKETERSNMYFPQEKKIFPVNVDKGAVYCVEDEVEKSFLPLHVLTNGVFLTDMDGRGSSDTNEKIGHPGGKKRSMGVVGIW